MAPEDYDLAGFAVGVVDREKIIDGSRVSGGDVLIGLTSSGVHSNGFSLVRKVFDIEHADLTTPMDELEGKSLGEALLAPTKLYVKAVLALIDGGIDLHGPSHITGGGFYENIPRCLPKGMTAKIDKSALWIDPIFRMIQRLGNIPEHDMFNTFNMGTGMVLVVAKEDVDKAVAALNSEGQGAKVIGDVVAEDIGVELL